MEIRDYLLNLIILNANNPDYILPSETFIATKFQASRTSVRHAFQNLKESGHIFTMQGKGAYINTKRPQSFHSLTNNISLIVPSLQSNHMHNILRGCTDFCNQNNLSLLILLCNNNESEENRYVNITVENSKGLILFPRDEPTFSKEIFDLSSSSFPSVLIDRTYPKLNFDYVKTDNFNMLFQATEKLITNGYKKICYITVQEKISIIIRERLNGFYAALHKHSILPPPFSVCKLINYNDNKNLIFFLDKYIPKIDSIIVNDGPLSLLIYDYCIKHKIEIGKQIKLFLLDSEINNIFDTLSIDYWNIQQNSYLIGYKACEVIYNKIYHIDSNSKILIPPIMIEKQSRAGSE